MGLARVGSRTLTWLPLLVMARCPPLLSWDDVGSSAERDGAGHGEDDIALLMARIQGLSCPTTCLQGRAFIGPYGCRAVAAVDFVAVPSG